MGTAESLGMSVEQRQAKEGKTKKALRELVTLIKTNASSYMMYFALIVIMLVFQLWSGGKFFTAQNITNLFNQAAYVAVLAIGMTIILILRHIDLSCGYVAGLSGAVVAILMEKMGRYSHYLVTFDGKFYDPNTGIMKEFDLSKLIGYLEIGSV